MSKKIAVVGPESTGKSTLSRQLAEHYQAGWVPEFAREYIDKLPRAYEKNDLLTIAQNQMALENEAAENHTLIFCDTNLLVIKIWSEFKYGDCHPWIQEAIERNNYDLHLLTNIDLPWQDDPQREHPQAREQLFDIYKNELDQMKVAYEIIQGQQDQRLYSAIAKVEKYI